MPIYAVFDRLGQTPPLSTKHDQIEFTVQAYFPSKKVLFDRFSFNRGHIAGLAAIQRYFRFRYGHL